MWWTAAALVMKFGRFASVGGSDGRQQGDATERRTAEHSMESPVTSLSKGVPQAGRGRARRIRPLRPESRPSDGPSEIHSQAPYEASARVRLLMRLEDAESLSERLCAAELSPALQRLLDQLWLRSVLIEQWRRTRLAERGEFQQRADRLLEALDPWLTAVER